MMAFGELVRFYAPGNRTDPYSGETVADDWNNPQQTLMALCGVEPVGSDEPPDTARQAVITGFRLYVDSMDSISPDWRASVRGTMMQIKGFPAQWVNPFTGWVAGQVMAVEVING
jgi:hypothetical protein